MKDPQDRARDDDRDPALRLVQDAAVAGRLSQPDADHRIQQIRAARTVGEIDLHLRDLQDFRPLPHVLPSPSAGPGPGQAPWPQGGRPVPGQIGHPVGHQGSPSSSDARTIVLVVAALVAFVVLLGVILVLLSAVVIRSVDDGTVDGPEDPVDAILTAS